MVASEATILEEDHQEDFGLLVEFGKVLSWEGLEHLQEVEVGEKALVVVLKIVIIHFDVAWDYVYAARSAGCLGMLSSDDKVLISMHLKLNVDEPCSFDEGC